jgi:phospholipid/cholesterol/gamma-HCH transport system substrate-binding protein
MQKQAPSIGRILIALGFTLSCFGLILFLWIAFGGPVPLKPESYKITAYFPETTTLAQESDVRIGGVSVGKVKEITLAPPEYRVSGNDTTEATLEIRPEFAPISEDARAILRQKTLLGETYIELTPGSEPGSEAAPVSLGAAANVSDAESKDIETVPEGGTLGISQTQDATQIDEIFNALDEETRTSFQRWMASSAEAVDNRGLDLNDAFGNLGPFVSDASDLLDILERQKASLKGLVRDTGTVFDALSAQDQALAGAITGSHGTFEALASEDEALAESLQILPTFERESKLTFARLDEFQADTRPLIQDLIPVARDLSPTLRSVRRLSPNLLSLFEDLDQLITATRRGFPALESFLNGLGPVLENLDPFLANLNPVIEYLEFQKSTVADFLAGPAVALSNSIDCPTDPCNLPAPRHYLRQLGYVSAETLGIHPARLATNRGNGYLAPGALTSFQSASTGIFPNFDCKNLDYSPETTTSSPEAQDEEIQTTSDPYPPGGGNSADIPDVSATFAACDIQGDFPASNFGEDYGTGRFPTLFSDP